MRVVFVKIDTDAEISGVGEATLEMKEKAVEAAGLELADYLQGQDPRHVERHFHSMYRDSLWRTGPVLMSALSTVEMGLLGYFSQGVGRPGLGLELNEEAFADHPYQPRPLRHYRGDLTDIRPPEAVPYF